MEMETAVARGMATVLVPGYAAKRAKELAGAQPRPKSSDRLGEGWHRLAEFSRRLPGALRVN
jgi:hypothetical protein